MHVIAGMYTFFKSRTKNFWLFEASVWLHLFSASFISVFIPVLLYEDGFGISTILLFYFLLHFINIPSNFLAGKITGRIGSRNSVVIATIFYLLFFLSFTTLETETVGTLILMAILAALYDGFYYVASLNMFMESSKNPENSGKNTGILNIIISLAYLLGPFAGSLILLLTKNEDYVLYAAAFFLFLSILPLFKMKSGPKNKEVKIMPIKEFFRSDRERKNHFALMFYKVGEGTEYILFPLYLFLIIGTLESVAVLAVLVPIFSFFFTYLSGNIKRENRRFFIQFGSLLIALLWLSRMYFDGNYALYAGSILMSLLIIFVRIPIDANIYRTGNEELHSLSSSVYKNSLSMFAKGILFGILFVLSFSLDIHSLFATAFFISAICSLVVIFINKYYWKKINRAELNRS